MIKAEDIYRETEGGKAVILHLFPTSASGFSGKKNFKLRNDDKNPSCTVFKSNDGNWLLQDKGGSDTKAYNCITLVQREMNLSYPQAIEWIAQKFCPDLLDDKSASRNLNPQADRTKVPGIDEIQVEYRKDGKFTFAELAILGHVKEVWDPATETTKKVNYITQETCDDLCLRPLASYTTAKKDDGYSIKHSANDGFPMYAYDYSSYGKIYQPVGDPKFRFLWYGSKKDKQRMPISGDKEFMARYQQCLDGTWEPETYLDEEGEKKTKVNNKWDKLIICSGPSDALNIHQAGYHVCWPNSETAEITEYQVKYLTDMAMKVYICYDIDDTGIRNMYKLAVQYPDLSIIRLPEELRQKRDRRGKPCKDAKDFFSYFRRPEIQDPVRLFKDIVKLSGGLQFWTAERSDDGKKVKYDINNDQMYSFLEARGYYTIETTAAKEGFTFCHMQDNVVTLIDKEAIVAECSADLLEYLRTHPFHYDQRLVNAIHRSKQINASSLTKLRRISPNFNAYTEDYDYFWFRNGIFRVGANGIEKIKASDCPYMVYDTKIIDHEFTPMQSMFEIDYSQEYRALRDQLCQLTPTTPEYYAVSRQIDTIPDVRRYQLTVKNWGTTFMQYLYNTGRAYWRQEEKGYALTAEQLQETQLNFISKCLAIGYMLSKHKNSGQPYAVYAMEMEQGDEGEHLGGTGKSLFLSSIDKLREQLYVDAQKLQEDRMQFAFQNVVKGKTDTVFLDDVNNRINLHLFMNMVTGKMVIEQKHASGFVLSFQESPKLGFTSNHAIKNFDDSLNRRIWFAAFSDYYHSDSAARKLKMRTPRTEFGKDLIDQYTPEEMNAFYNFMFTCLMMWHKIHERVQPPMKSIVKRTLVKSMTEDFFYWAEEYFTPERLDCLVDVDEACNSYTDSINKRAKDFMTKQKFNRRIREYCQYHDWEYNPDKIFTNDSDRKANRVHKKVNGEDHYYFYIDTSSNPVKVAAPAMNQGGEGASETMPDDDTPIFG